MVSNIKKKMKEIIARDYKFKQISVSRADAYEYVKSLGEEEKMLNYLFMTHDSITMYELDDDYNYFFYIMPPSTGCLKRFDLTFVAPKGVVLSYPINNVVPRFVPSPQVLDAFKTYEEKLKGIGVTYAGDLNQIVIDGKINDFIQMNEILYDKNMENVAQMVVKNKNIRAVFISGPSSSGKTTTSKKLAMYLKSYGKDSLVLSTDDYFVNREDSPRKEDGSYEFEIVDALDINLFGTQMRQLLKGDEVVIPTYNFIAGIKEYKRKPVTLKDLEWGRLSQRICRIVEKVMEDQGLNKSQLAQRIKYPQSALSDVFSPDDTGRKRRLSVPLLMAVCEELSLYFPDVIKAAWDGSALAWLKFHLATKEPQSLDRLDAIVKAIAPGDASD
jgi:hypothetical protein